MKRAHDRTGTGIPGSRSGTGRKAAPAPEHRPGADLPALRRPIRTCVGCRQPDTQAKLLRVAVAEIGGARRPILDARRRLAGRGAWVHPVGGCVARAQRGLARTLRMAVEPADLAAITAAVTQVVTSQSRRDVVEDTRQPGASKGSG